MYYHIVKNINVAIAALFIATTAMPAQAQNNEKNLSAANNLQKKVSKQMPNGGNKAMTKATVTAAAGGEGGGGNVILKEDFESITLLPEQIWGFHTIPEGWTTIDADGDGNNWNGFGIAPEVEVAGHNSDKCVTSESFTNEENKALTPNNYLISPMVEGATRVTFYACSQDEDYGNEHFGLCASSTGKAEGDFKIVEEWDINQVSADAPTTRVQGKWKAFDVQVPAGTKYIAFRHFNSTDQFRINIDDVTVYGTSTAIENVAADTPTVRQGIYTLSGVRMQTDPNSLPKGIYIVNGKKVVKQ